MSFILHIETGAGNCSVCVSENERLLSCVELNQENIHAEKLIPFCDEALLQATLKYSDLHAVSVSCGPGSYTGLRIGVSAAKGFCYTLNIPLISVPSLEALAQGMSTSNDNAELLIPMIDARRMEVYAAVYNNQLQLLHDAQPVVVTENQFQEFTTGKKVAFGGDGMPKCKLLLADHNHAYFCDDISQSAKHLIMPAYRRYVNKEFADVAYFEPFYLKTFQPGPKRSS
ncbi:MAG: tRNA (adenosine(37)-N6)-threonylcarbamoyltransferase complex dimerization subunit type 1 TsaB [Bacteroidetes bacterium]|nr:tRNA (adenosine(37)-N6)-threonylcarbamoyltransferase complex dimerization subunit type 1 TsaB [Bacteroidota bacterium]